MPAPSKTSATEQKQPPRPPLPSRAELEARIGQLSLVEFVQRGWSIVEPGVTYRHNWHIEAICEQLERVTKGKGNRNLVINIPPRHMKSLTVAVFWPAWVWIKRPEAKFLFASYADRLATAHSVACRRLILSEWYQQRWPLALASDQNVKTKFENVHLGFRLATSVGAVVTGFGGDFLVVDDPHNVVEAESPVKREAVIEWWDHAMSPRVNDPDTGVRVVIQQRLHEGDLAGHLLAKNWSHLVLPAEYEPQHPYAWEDDPRQDPGEPLWPSLWHQDWLDEKKLELGSYAYAGQYQQRPAPMEGGILKRDWWRFYDPTGEIPPFSRFIFSWDCAFKDTDGSDYVVGQLWGQDLANVYLLGQIRARLDFVATCNAVTDFERWASPRGWRGGILIEDKANGPAVIASLRDRVPGLIPVEPEGGKEARAHAIAPMVEAGNAYLPSGFIPAPEGYTPTPTDEFIEECASFPNAIFDDQVDATTQALIRFRGGGDGRVRTGGYRADVYLDR